jgi:thiol-disulfide isomerase/thioredoxin
MNRLLVAILASGVLVAVAEARQQPAPQTQTQQAPRNIIAEVRGLIAKDDFDAAEKTLRQFIAEKGHTPDALEALSWLGRGALAKKRFDAAYSYASETYGLSVDALKNRKLDAEPRLPIALGAAIEVQAHVMAQRGQRSEAIYFLQRELEDYQATSIRTRLQKNIHLLSLEGKPAPAYETNEYIGSKPAGIEELRGKPVLLFFWAHWCPDCKAMAPVLAELQAAYKDKGLVVVAPTQRYGYVAKRAPADAKTEMDYIGHVAREFYAAVDWTVPVSADSFANYGSSTTPTVVLVDRQGIVRLYHPGQMTKAELEPHLRALVDARTTNPQ